VFVQFLLQPPTTRLAAHFVLPQPAALARAYRLSPPPGSTPRCLCRTF
jgi:hypothetical protein